MWVVTIVIIFDGKHDKEYTMQNSEICFDL